MSHKTRGEEQFTWRLNGLKCFPLGSELLPNAVDPEDGSLVHGLANRLCLGQNVEFSLHESPHTCSVR